VDPAVNFHVRRAIVSYLKEGKVQGGVEREVVSFKDLGDGVFFPTEVQTKAIQTDGTRLLVWIDRVKIFAVNQPVSQSAFDFTFPKDSLVRHFPPENYRVKVDLWGPDNRPAREIKGVADLFPEQSERVQPGKSQLLLFCVANALIAVGLIAFLVLRQKSRSRK
jgi:hypothetical protein